MKRISTDKPRLRLPDLLKRARVFAEAQSRRNEPKLYGVTDGKAVGTFLEKKFITDLAKKFTFKPGSAAKGIDLPGLQVDIKTTSIRQPQSSSPFSSPRQKVFGLGYSLLVFVYQKRDNKTEETAKLTIKHVIYVDKLRTSDFQMTKGLRQIIGNDGNAEDLVGFMKDRMLPADDIELRRIATELLRRGTPQGYLTISNALQWRLQYKRVIGEAGTINGITRIH